MNKKQGITVIGKSKVTHSNTALKQAVVVGIKSTSVWWLRLWLLLSNQRVHGGCGCGCWYQINRCMVVAVVPKFLIAAILFIIKTAQFSIEVIEYYYCQHMKHLHPRL